MVYNVNLKKARGTMGIGIIFALAGLFFLVIMVGVFISSFNKKNSLDSETKATNITWEEHYDSDDGTTYSPNYEYKVNGTIYVCKSSTSSSTKSGNGTVYYDSSNPGRCMTDFDDNTNGFLFIFLLLPMIFIIVGGLQIKKSIVKTKITKNLASNGVLVKNIPYRLIDSNITVNNNRLKCISTTYKFPDGVLREIKSEPLSGNILSDADGMCDMLYDPNNYDNYFIDFGITPTGQGNPQIIYYDQTQQGTNNLNYANMNSNLSYTNMVNNMNYNNYNYDDSYNPENKF